MDSLKLELDVCQGEILINVRNSAENTNPQICEMESSQFGAYVEKMFPEVRSINQGKVFKEVERRRETLSGILANAISTLNNTAENAKKKMVAICQEVDFSDSIYCNEMKRGVGNLNSKCSNECKITCDDTILKILLSISRRSVVELKNRNRDRVQNWVRKYCPFGVGELDKLYLMKELGIPSHILESLLFEPIVDAPNPELLE